MLLLPVEWFTVLTTIAAGPLPSITLTTPRQENSGTPTYSSQTSTPTIPWWITTLGKECCTLGTVVVKLLTLSLLKNIRFAEDTNLKTSDESCQVCWLLCFFIDDALKKVMFTICTFLDFWFSLCKFNAINDWFHLLRSRSEISSRLWSYIDSNAQLNYVAIHIKHCSAYKSYSALYGWRRNSVGHLNRFIRNQQW